LFCFLLIQMRCVPRMKLKKELYTDEARQRAIEHLATHLLMIRDAQLAQTAADATAAQQRIDGLTLTLAEAQRDYQDAETRADDAGKEIERLTAQATSLGADDELVVRVLDGKSPVERAAAAVAGTDLGRRAPPSTRPDRRRELYDGGVVAVAASADPMLELARLVDGESRRLRKIAEAADEVKKQAQAEIVRARFAREGLTLYPDATFTLRLSYGVVKGGTQAGIAYPAITTFGGLFTRAEEKQEMPPFDLPPRWLKARPTLAADAAFVAKAFNFASTADIIGGNSGSPVVNAAGELVGVIFDGNIDSLVLDVAYDDQRARAVAVDATGIVAALQRVYAADMLLAEILTKADKKK
jgi:hypothetical protein